MMEQEPHISRSCIYIKQGETGFRIESVPDTQDRSRTLASLYLGNGKS